MVSYKPEKGIGFIYIFGSVILTNGIILLILTLVNSYIISIMLKILFGIIIIYQLYYLVIYFSLKYVIDDENLYIYCLIRNIKIPVSSMEGYRVERGTINGIKLSGFGTNNFALGRFVIKQIGTTHMYATANKNILYIKTKDKTYGISPRKIEGIKEYLSRNHIEWKDWEYTWNKDTHLHKEKSFIIPFIIVSIIISVITLNPFVFYLMNKLPAVMPLSFDASFLPVDFGSGKQFAFNQMMYGVLNMAILFCMYYAAHFYAKYDKKSANKFIYISLLIAAAFLIIQIRIILLYK